MLATQTLHAQKWSVGLRTHAWAQRVRPWDWGMLGVHKGGHSQSTQEEDEDEAELRLAVELHGPHDAHGQAQDGDVGQDVEDAVAQVHGRHEQALPRRVGVGVPDDRDGRAVEGEGEGEGGPPAEDDGAEDVDGDAEADGAEEAVVEQQDGGLDEEEGGEVDDGGDIGQLDAC